ncbi:MAG: tetratricopeptide repeat protein [Bacteroidota bacterium]
MLSARFRFALMGAFLILAAWLMIKGLYPYGLGLLMGFGLLVWGYFRNGSVYLAYWRLRRDQYDKADRLLDEVQRPKWLGRVVQGYYYLCRGHIAFHEQRYTEAQMHFRTAYELRPPNGNDRALILLNLAQLSNIQGDKKQARQYLKEAETEKMSPELAQAMADYRKKLRK